MRLLCAITLALAWMPAAASEPFKDVPKDHWAAGAVQKMKDDGVVRGYPDGTFKGDQPVTRYELAAALVRFVEFIQENERLLAKDARKPATVRAPEAVRPGKDASGQKASPRIASTAGGSAAALVDGGFLPKDSILLKDGPKQVTPDELADALASVAKRVIELRVKEEPIGR